MSAPHRRESEAIVLAVTASGEAHKHARLLVASGERIDALAPAAGRSRRRFAGALQPGAKIHASWSARRAGPILDEAQLLVAPPKPDPLEVLYYAAHVLELAEQVARPGAEEPHLFRLVDRALAALAARGARPALARYVDAWMLRLAGWFPEPDRCAACGEEMATGAVELVADDGAFHAACASGRGWRLAPDAAAWLRATRRCRPEAVPDPPPAAERELEAALSGLLTTAFGRPLKAWGALVRWERGRRGARGGTAREAMP